MKRTISLFLLVTFLLIACCSCGTIVINTSECKISYPNGDKYLSGNQTYKGDLDELYIHWISGSIEINYNNDGVISITETTNKDVEEGQKVHSYLNDSGKLMIEYAKNGVYTFGKLEKNVIISIPEGTTLNVIEVNNVSADCNVEVASGKAVLNTVSGDLSITECKVVKVSAVSAKVSIATQTMESLDMDTVSGKVEILCESLGDVDIDTVSGDIKLSIGEDNGFTVDFCAVSGKVNCDYPTVLKDGKMVYGNGNSKISISSVSADLTIQVLK